MQLKNPGEAAAWWNWTHGLLQLELTLRVFYRSDHWATTPHSHTTTAKWFAKLHAYGLPSFVVLLNTLLLESTYKFFQPTQGSTQGRVLASLSISAFRKKKDINIIPRPQLLIYSIRVDLSRHSMASLRTIAVVCLRGITSKSSRSVTGSNCSMLSTTGKSAPLMFKCGRSSGPVPSCQINHSINFGRRGCAAACAETWSARTHAQKKEAQEADPL